MKFITAIITNIRALVGSIAQPAAPVATVTAPHIRALLLHLCNQDTKQATWVARWLAYPLRHRGAKMATALLVAGDQGAGQHLLFEKIIGPMYGSQAQLGGVLPRRTFNGWAIGKRYAVLQDIRFADWATGTIKNLIASAKIVVHRHEMPDIAISNSLNVVLLTADAMSPDYENRRLFTLVPQQPLPVELASAVMHEIETGGLVDFHQYLTHELDMADFDQYASTSYAIESAVTA